MKNFNNYFGFTKLSSIEKKKKIMDIFTSIHKKYDLMNDIMSMGFHRLWKKTAIQMGNISPDDLILDLAGGTGDLSLNILKILSNSGHIILSDINEYMILEGRIRIENKGYISNISYAIADAESLPFAKNTFNTVLMAFGFRNIENKEKALSSIFNVIKPGGCLIILEFSKLADSFIIKFLYNIYLSYIIPYLGKFIANNEKAYRYLSESIYQHPDQESLKNMMIKIGYKKVQYINLSKGIVSIHKGLVF